MRWLVRLLLGAALLYSIALFALVVGQRRLLYFPDGPIGPAKAWGFPLADTLTLRTADGETIVAWHQPAAPRRPLFLFFHGNGGTMATRAGMLRELAADGSGFLAIDYRGYGGSTGSPSEAGLLEDGRAAYAEVLALHYAPSRIVILGESLGTGVAVPTAADKPIRALILDSPFSSTLDVARSKFWFFPVRLAMTDTFQSIRSIGRVTAPKLFLSGSADTAVPPVFARRLFDEASEPKTFVGIAGGTHLVLSDKSVVASMKRWLAALPSDENATSR